jgi:N-(2-amino-2-carboxyethyl)-L-glutamate synthase
VFVLPSTKTPSRPRGVLPSSLHEGIGNTPAVPLTVSRRADQRTVLAKLEWCNPTGSAKDRTALGIIEAMNRVAPFAPYDVVVESTSGNLGLAMTRLLLQIDCRLVAVVDPNTPERTRTGLAAAGAEVVLVDEPDPFGGYLLTRLRKVQELCDAHPHYRWSNQYENPANPSIHERTTGPEIVRESGGDVDAVYVAVSTGGTLAGVSRHLRAAAPRARIVAVDAVGSRALGGRAGPRLLSGIGASRVSIFLTPESYEEAVYVRDVDAFALCRLVLADTGVAIGGSSGSVLDACISHLYRRNAPRLPVCVLADGGDRYANSFYDDDWLAEKGVLGAVVRREDELRDAGFAFEFEGAG